MPISTMKKLTVLAGACDADAIVRKLVRLKCVQIQAIAEDAAAGALRVQDARNERGRIETELSRIREAIPILARYSRRKSTIGRRVHYVNRREFLANGRDAHAWKAIRSAIELDAALQTAQEEMTQNEVTRHALLPWLSYDAPLSEKVSAHVRMQFGSCPVGVSPVSALEELGAVVETVSEDKEGTFLAVTYHKDVQDPVEALLSAHGFVKSLLPKGEQTAQKMYDALDARDAALDNEIMRLRERLADVADALDDVEVLSDIVETDLNVCVQKEKLLQTRNCSILEGWVPETALDKVTSVLSSYSCACEASDPEEGEEPPVLLRNNPFSSTFEWVIEMYSYPKYGTFDPTLIMSIFYFLIFGMMFADVGYGLLLVIGCFGGIKLLNPREGMKRMLLMFGYCGISCMLMGVLFGGWFGNLPTAVMNSFFPEFKGQAETTPLGSFFYNGLIFNPVDASTYFLVLSLAMGEIHLIAGMAVNLVETWKKGARLEAICSAVPFWILFAGIDLMAPTAIYSMFVPGGADAATAAVLAILFDIGLYLMIAGFATILFCRGLAESSVGAWIVKGLGGLYSLISIASDLLSYSRILALGLVAAVIAQVINMLTGLGATGPLGFVFMLVVMIVGHALNLAINLLGTFVHAARLQYIEFFGKFYEDGGEVFTPALPAENYSEDIQDTN